MRRIITAAREGKTILEFPVYDGSETGDKLYNTLTVIGAPIAPGAQPPDDAAANAPVLAKLTRWPVTISYFEQQTATEEQTGEQTPVYSISFELYENGISRALVLDYNDFTINGESDLARCEDAKGVPLRAISTNSVRPFSNGGQNSRASCLLSPVLSPPHRGRTFCATGRRRVLRPAALPVDEISRLVSLTSSRLDPRRCRSGESAWRPLPGVSSSRPASKIRVASCVGAPSACARVRKLEVSTLELERYGRASERACL